MKSFIDTLYYAQAQSGPGSKKRINTAFSQLDVDGWRCVYYALNTYLMFNVKKYDWPTKFADSDSDASVLFELLDRLHSRELTGNAARAAVTATLSLFTERTAGAIRFILLKDLKAGISAETFNELYFGVKVPTADAECINHLAGKINHIPIYSCQLAEKMPKKTDKKQFNWNRRLISDCKLDGTRNQAFTAVCENSVTHRARSGKPSDHLNELFDDELIRLNFALSKYFSLPENTKWVIDGEAKGETFQATMNAKSSSNSDAKEKLNLYVYDCIPTDNWITQTTWEVSQEDRLVAIKTCLENISAKKLKPTEWVYINSRDEGVSHFEECVNLGYEGTVVKDPKSYYEWKRSANWTKFKPVNTYDGYITGFYAGDENSDIADVLGGVYVAGVDENGEKFECKVGSGFPKYDEPERPSRRTIWENQAEFLGKCIEIEADPNVSIKEDREVNSLRWGVFKKMRPDKDT